MIARPQNMVVKESLPQAPPGFLGVGKACLLFQGLDEINEIAKGFTTLEKQVNMIWHNTVGMHSEGKLGGFGPKHVHKPGSTHF